MQREIAMPEIKTTAIVTGASRGSGRGIAAALTQAGAQVVGVARDRERLAAVGVVAAALAPGRLRTR
jgi:NAD(P)-dependent dehydrogenase (short-subunit alcohol dehydrogenase family)